VSHDDDLPDRRMLSEHRFDLARLDAVAADLDLLIDTPAELEVAVLEISSEIPRPVEPRSRNVREAVGHEAIGGQLRSVQVSSAHTVAADVQLPQSTDGHRLEVSIQDVELRIGDRAADRHPSGSAASSRGLVDTAADHGLGRAVFVDEAGLGSVSLPEGQAVPRERLSSDDEDTRAACGAVRRKLPAEQQEVRRGDLDGAQIRRGLERVAQALEALLFRHEHHSAPDEQWEEKTGDREVEP
jgi:hypothetical protein